MALIECPKCGKEISDKANECPNCNYIIQDDTISKNVKENVQKKSYKKYNLLILVLVAIISFVIGIIIGKVSEHKTNTGDTHVQEASSLSDDTEEIVTTESEGNNNESLDDTETQSNELKSAEVGQELSMETSYGTLLVTVDAVKEIDDNDVNEGNKMVLVECTIENTSFEDPYNDSLFLENYLTVLDEDNFVIESESSGQHEIDGYYFNTEIPKGSNGREYVNYQIKKEHNALLIRLNDQYEIKAEIQ